MKVRYKLRGGRGRGSIRKKVIVLAIIKNHFLDVWFTSRDIDKVLAEIGIDRKSYGVLADLGRSKLLDSEKVHARTNQRAYKLYCVNEMTYRLFDNLWNFKDFKPINGYTEYARSAIEDSRRCERVFRKFSEMRNYAIRKLKAGDEITAMELAEKFDVRPIDAGRILAKICGKNGGNS